MGNPAQKGVAQLLKQIVAGMTPIGMLTALAWLVLTWADFRQLSKSYAEHCLEQTETLKAQEIERSAVRIAQERRDRDQDSEFQMIHPALVEVKTNTENMKEDIADIKRMLEKHIMP